MIFSWEEELLLSSGKAGTPTASHHPSGSASISPASLDPVSPRILPSIGSMASPKP